MRKNCGKKHSRDVNGSLLRSFCTHIRPRIRIEFREMGSCCAGQKKRMILYAAGVLACEHALLLGFVYRVVLSRLQARKVWAHRLVNSVYLVLNAGCLSVTACVRG